jgi:uncharacterized membrane protein
MEHPFITFAKGLALTGKKTYIVVIVGFALLIAEKALGYDIPYFDVANDQIVTYSLALLAIAGIRIGVTTENKRSVETANANAVAAAAIAANKPAAQVNAEIEAVKALSAAEVK